MDLELSKPLQETINGLSDEFSDRILDVYQSTGDTFVRVDPEIIVDVCKSLKEKHHFIYLADLLGADRFTSEERFEVIYNLVSLRDRERLFLKTWLEEENPQISTVSKVWKNANWYERQVYDMFGITFTDHPDMRRIYMPEDFDYFPLRKEFPLLGIPGSIDLPNTTPDPE